MKSEDGGEFAALLKFIQDNSEFKVHSQKQSAHWAVDITAQVVPC